MFTGSMVALVTPFRNGQVDKDKIKELIEFHIKEGTDAVVPCGTTGESSTLSHDEHKEIIRLVVETVAKRVLVIAGAGSNCTNESLMLAKHAKEVGADGILVITPYYNRPTQNGLYEHYTTIIKDVDLPVIIYNVPSRTGVDILPETVARLAEFDNIVGIKEATGDLKRHSKIVELCGEKITLISGDDFTLLPTLSVGGKGVISVVANIIPKLMANLIREFENGNFQEALNIHYKIFPLCEAMFIETNPVPVKEALGLLGMIKPEVRLPLVMLTEEHRQKVRETLVNAGLIVLKEK